MPKLWRLLLTLLSAAALAILLWRSPPEPFRELLTEAGPKTTTPASYMTKARTTQFSEQGAISYILESAAVFYFETEKPDQPEVTFEQPTLIFFNEVEDARESNSPWVISSNYAEGSEIKDELWLSGDVVVKKREAISRIPSKLTTSELLVKPNLRYAETDKPVIISDDSGSTESTGLRLFFDDERIEFLSNVKSQYLPPR